MTLHDTRMLKDCNCSFLPDDRYGLCRCPKAVPEDCDSAQTNVRLLSSEKNGLCEPKCSYFVCIFVSFLPTQKPLL